MLAEVLREAKARATDEFHIDQASRMHVAEAFPIQSNIIKGTVDIDYRELIGNGSCRRADDWLMG